MLKETIVALKSTRDAMITSNKRSELLLLVDFIVLNKKQKAIFFSTFTFDKRASDAVSHVE
jgi:hypothetical protein